VIVDPVHSGDHGKAGPSALLIVVKGTGLGPGSVYQGKDYVLERTSKRKGVRQRQDHVQDGAPGEHGQDAPQHVVLVGRQESVSVSHKYPGWGSSPPHVRVQLRILNSVT